MNSFSVYLEAVESVAINRGLKCICTFQYTSPWNTEKNNLTRQESYVLPPRIAYPYMVIGFCNLTAREIEYVSAIVDRLCVTVYLDVEKKFPSYFSDSCSDSGSSADSSCSIDKFYSKMFGEDKVRLMACNQITVSAFNRLFMSLVRVPSGANVGIIGMGNIGFKLALLLTELGVNVNCYSPDYGRVLEICKTIDLVKPRYTQASPRAHRDAITALSTSETVVLCANKPHVITPFHKPTLHSGLSIIDIGKESIHPEIKAHLDVLKVKLINLNVSNSILEYVLPGDARHDETRFKPLMRRVGEERLVSGGFPGRPGDVVVDNAEDPSFILGYISDSFSFKREFKRYV